MKNNLTSNTVYFITLLLLVNVTAFAEMSSLSLEELTDTYIQDTTVIVRQQKAQEVVSSLRMSLKVTPIEQATQVLPEAKIDSFSAVNQGLSTYEELNNQITLKNTLAPQLPSATTEFLTEPLSESFSSQIRQAYGIEIGEAVNLSKLPFLTDLAPSNLREIPVGLRYQFTESSFTINIPNAENLNSQQFTTPRGEFGVNITPSNIEYILNLPR
jgi:capsular polysaccharide biosynthesis protein